MDRFDFVSSTSGLDAEMSDRGLIVLEQCESSQLKRYQLQNRKNREFYNCMYFVKSFISKTLPTFMHSVHK